MLLQLANVDIVDHISRHRDIYRQALATPPDAVVLDVLVEHFVEYSRVFVGRVPALGLSGGGVELAAQFVAHGFAGAIWAWLLNPSISRDDLEDAAAAVAPARWS